MPDQDDEQRRAATDAAGHQHSNGKTPDAKQTEELTFGEVLFLREQREERLRNAPRGTPRH